MYEILKQYESLEKREISVSELRELLGIGKNEYVDRTGWSNFKIRVLDSCQQALKENTDICYTYERGKTGKGGKWLTIIFHITKNADYKDPPVQTRYSALQISRNDSCRKQEQYDRNIIHNSHSQSEFFHRNTARRPPLL